MYVRSKITYASPAWGALISNSNWTKLEAIQNIAMRTILGAPWYVRNTTIRNAIKIPTVKEEIIHLTKNLSLNLNNANHSHLRNIGKTVGPPEIYKLRPLTLLKLT
jgi:hypothetical protein